MTSSLQTDLNNWLGWLAAPLGGLEGTTLNWFNTYLTGRRHFLNLCTYYFGKHDNLFDILQGHFLALNGFMCICFNFVKWLVIIMWINILRLMTLVFTCSARWLGCTEYYYRLPFQYRTGNFSLKLNENKTEMFIISTSEQRRKKSGTTEQNWRCQFTHKKGHKTCVCRQMWWELDHMLHWKMQKWGHMLKK